MESKFIIIVVFASLSQFAQVLSSELAYGLSEEQETVLSQIVSTEETAILAKYAANTPFYTILENLAAQSIFNLMTSTEDLFAGINTAVAKTKKVTDYFLDTIPAVLGQSCDAVENAREPLYNISDELLIGFEDAFALAQSGNYSANLDQFILIKNTTMELLVDFDVILFDALRTCLDINDSTTVAVVQKAQAGSDGALSQSANALLSAIKLYAAAVSAENGDVALLLKIEDFRRQAFIELRADIEHKFSLLRTLFIDSCLNQTGIVSGLAAIQYAQTVSFHKLKDANQGIFETINHYLIEAAVGFSNPGDDDFARIYAAQAEAIAHSIAGNQAFLTSALALYPNASSSIAISADELCTVLGSGIADFFTAIRIALVKGSNTSDTVSQIEVLREAASLNANASVDIIYTAILGDQILDDDAEAAFTNYQEEAVNLIILWAENIYNAVLVLANSVDVTQDDFEAVSSAEASVYSVLEEFTNGIAEASFLVLDARIAD